MNETLTPGEAARILADTSRYEDNLVQRTEGLTSILWGFVTSAIFLTYGLGAVANGLTPWIASVLWIPWIAAGFLATWALWRSASLSGSVPWSGADHRRIYVRAAFVTVVLAAMFAILRPHTAATPLVIVGLMWTAMALFNVYRSSPRGRLLWAGSGVTLAVAGLGLILAGAPD